MVFKQRTPIIENQANPLIPLYAGYPTIAQNKKNSKEEVVSLMKFPCQYLPFKNDLVIGIVKVRAAEHFIVDIKAPLDGILGALEFDGATKRNKPNLQVGATVFCRVCEYNKHTGARLSCINKGYSTGQSVSKSEESQGNEMGELKGGLLTYALPHIHGQIQKHIL